MKRKKLLLLSTLSLGIAPVATIAAGCTSKPQEDPIPDWYKKCCTVDTKERMETEKKLKKIQEKYVSAPVKNELVNAKKINSVLLWSHKENDSNSYRIPNIIKTKNSIVTTIDKRWLNNSDGDNWIDINHKVSFDQGKTFGKALNTLKIQTPKEKKV
ncbi:sialidase family protein [Mycoplasmopsis cricetuli]|uniref:sialidase family protein n=1 Tax=Mycoplasmopsis cricetuli TaxID=171283 RepID=UPI00046EFD68|nr:sialidase family protein [Mycoplasmopsis cricetuli]